MAKILKDGKEIFPKKKRNKKFIIAAIFVIVGILAMFVLPGGFIKNDGPPVKILSQPIIEQPPVEEMDRPQTDEDSPVRDFTPTIEQPMRPLDELPPTMFMEEPEPMLPMILGFLKDVFAMISTLVGILVGIKTLKEKKKTT